MTACPQTLLAAFENARSILFLTHARPDGDGMGAIVAMARATRASGRQAHLLVPDKIPARYDFLFADEQPAGPERFAELADAADLVVVADTCARAQLDGIDQAIIDRCEKVVVLDHHATSEHIGNVQWVDTTAAAAGVLAAEVLAALGWPVDEFSAEALLTAITSDTGWLRFANTDGRCLRAAAGLLDAGVRPDKLYMRLFQCDRPQRLVLMTRMLETLRLECDGRLASMVIRGGDFKSSDALPEETENLVNEALRIGTVETSLLLVENGNGEVRVSLRSRDAVDVAAIARPFGGGGHARAAGLRLKMDIEELRNKLTAACAAVLENK